MTCLSVNVNKVATLRNTRNIGIPSVVRMARIALEAGAHGITIHPRPDERHIRRGDVAEIAELLRSYPGRELNIEGNPFHGLLEHCTVARPQQATLVPDEVSAATSDHGWPLTGMPQPVKEELRQAIHALHELGARVSLFVDPLPEVIREARALGADRVELYTEPYARAFAQGHARDMLLRYRYAADAALSAGLAVNAGHDLNLDNLGPFLETIPEISEVSIGHALVADALEFGMAEAVRRYLAICARTAGPSGGKGSSTA
ncbi:MAG: pyridoxine 5'-phosphate synthase [Candidatus Binatia bacterium]|nr:MAG: pyridoxine 5'-phosphate synthase [Candidatus Binatia bacterium]